MAAQNNGSGWNSNIYYHFGAGSDYLGTDNPGFRKESGPYSYST